MREHVNIRGRDPDRRQKGWGKKGVTEGVVGVAGEARIRKRVFTKASV